MARSSSSTSFPRKPPVSLPVLPFTRLVAALAAVVLLAGCAGPGQGVAAVINGAPIDAALVERLVEAQLAASQTDVSGLSPDERAQTVGQSQRQVLTALIRIEVVAQVADEEDVEITEEDLDERFAQEAEAQGGEEALEQLLEQSGLTIEDFRELVLTDLARQEALQERFSESGEGELQEVVTTAMGDARVEVASRFGTWDPQGGQVVPTDLIGDTGGGAPAPGGETPPPTPAPTATD